MQTPVFLDCGEAMLVVEFAAIVAPEISERVLALDDALAARALPGVVELVPTFRSLAVHYDPLVIPRTALIEAITGLIAGLDHRPQAGACWTVPVCYDAPHGQDLAEAAAHLGQSPDHLAKAHSEGHYRVYMYGFAPGFAYLGGGGEAVRIARRSQPRPPHPANAIMIGGGLAAIASFPMPTGWWVLGCTPERLFSPGRHPDFLVAVGDTIRFEPIDAATFTALDQRAAAGDIIARRVGAA